ncbi:Crp/Fnr family transcriptional regulator [Fusobacterium hominis]|uniref:Crp/Fnr family transcriptional regulator n=1 Tax=Fusobacterium hominis TaxID=2764326 RepID=A0A7G9GUV0_9FUSO|nr:Crp/Fnr family transcriptional regulator [Fusobacterium hominis]QNM14582.1 Crp/Fnr family transcriptional regulator [Fusobacterium hominis]
MTNIDLNKIEFFKGIDNEKIIADLTKIDYKILKFKKDDIVAFRGDEIKGMYINLKGTLVTEMLKDSGETKKIEELSNGKIMASAFIFGSFNNFPVDIIAKSDVEILYIEKKELLKLLTQDKILLERFLNEISGKAQFLSKNLWESISNKRIDKKLAEYFLNNEKNQIVELNISIKELSEYFNVSRPSLSRVLKELVDNKKIEKIKKGMYKILERNYLENL